MTTFANPGRKVFEQGRYGEINWPSLSTTDQAALLPMLKTVVLKVGGRAAIASALLLGFVAG